MPEMQQVLIGAWRIRGLLRDASCNKCGVPAVNSARATVPAQSATVARPTAAMTADLDPNVQLRGTAAGRIDAGCFSADNAKQNVGQEGQRDHRAAAARFLDNFPTS